MTTGEFLEKIKSFLHDVNAHLVGILVTADGEGSPHATYMGTMASPACDRLLTMTAPDSQKVINILENPHVEWLFTDEKKEELLYVRGMAKVIQEPSEVAEAWREMPEESREYFLSYQSVGMEFLIFETTIESFEFRIPRRNEVHRLERSEIHRLLA